MTDVSQTTEFLGTTYIKQTVDFSFTGEDCGLSSSPRRLQD